MTIACQQPGKCNAPRLHLQSNTVRYQEESRGVTARNPEKNDLKLNLGRMSHFSDEGIMRCGIVSSLLNLLLPISLACGFPFRRIVDQHSDRRGLEIVVLPTPNAYPASDQPRSPEENRQWKSNVQNAHVAPRDQNASNSSAMETCGLIMPSSTP